MPDTPSPTRAALAALRATTTHTAPILDTAPRPVMTVNEFIRDYGLGRTKVYQELNAGRLKAIKIGRRTMIRRADAEAWLAGLATFTPKSAA